MATSSREIAPPKPLARSRRGPQLLLGAGFAVAACILGFYGDSRALFQDESFIVWITGSSWSSMFRAFGTEPFPPLYHILIKLWMEVFGHSEVGLRSFSGACLLASFAVIAWMGRPLFQAGELRSILVVLIAAKVLTWNAIYGRMYTLMFLESCVVYLAFVGLFSGQAPRTSSAVWLAVANLSGMMTHYYFAFVLMAEGLAFLLYYRRRSWGLFFACVVAPVAVFAVAWGPVLRAQLASERFKFGGPPRVLPWSILGSTLVDYFGLRRWLPGVPLLVLLIASRRRGGRWRLERWRSLFRRLWRDPRSHLFGLFGAVTFVGPFAAARLKDADFYKVVPTPVLPLAVLVALLLRRSDRWLRLAAGVAVVAVVLFADARGRHEILEDPVNNREAIAVLRRQAREGDAIVCIDNYYTLFDYYLGDDPIGRTLPILGFPEDLLEHPGWYNEAIARGDAARFSASLEAFDRQIAHHLKDHPAGRVWVVEASWAAATTKIAIDRLEATMKPTQRIAVKGDGFHGYVLFEARPKGAGPG